MERLVVDLCDRHRVADTALPREGQRATMADRPNMIELIDVHKSFGDHPVLTGLNLKIRRRETFCIIGRNGIGKTVTFKHVLGLLRPDRGRVIIDEQN